MAALFCVAAALQLNDPDPLRWIAIYVAAAAVCGLAVIGRGWARWAAAAVFVAALLWASAIGHDAWGRTTVTELFEPMEPGGGPIEVGREAVGLLIIAAWMAAVAWRSRAAKTRS